MLIAFQPDGTDVIVSLPKALTIVSAMMDRCRILNEQKQRGKNIQAN